ncbi:hypothetical protein FDECE_11866 [Fusarium decemcellulare]|nr:hypothetical protein FDECE_11866 [Fusarium decemcellulare]
MEQQDTPAPKRTGRVPQLTEVRAPDDDWTGITKSSDRRRRQNRLNQRAYRRRKLEQSEAAEQLVTQGQSSFSVASPEGWRIVEDARKRAVTYAFTQLVYMQYTLKKPRLVYLPSLIRLNAINAITQNAQSIGFPLEGLCRDDLISPFNAFGPSSSSEEKEPKELSFPEHLRPTPLQRAIEHHPWSDLLPIPRLRDNIINGFTSGAFDEDELCEDLLGVVCTSQRDEAFLIVWGDPTDLYSWEVSVGFLKKWGFLLRGCPELIDSTNRWRLKRGEAKLNIRV